MPSHLLFLFFLFFFYFYFCEAPAVCEESGTESPSAVCEKSGSEAPAVLFIYFFVEATAVCEKSGTEAPLAMADFRATASRTAFASDSLRSPDGSCSHDLPQGACCR